MSPIISEHISCDVLVVGSGAAGLRASIAAREHDLDVWVISKGLPGKGSSTILSGGVFAGTSQGASPQRHLERTLKAGRGINQQELVEILVKEGPARLKELVEWGIKGELRYGYLYAKGPPPVWGQEIVRCLLTRAKKMGVRLIGGLAVGDLKLREGVAGVLAHSVVKGKWIKLTAKAVVLATGGAGALYLHHDNPQRMLGEGYALALGAGATLQDMEFVQFYPLCVLDPPRPPLVIPPRLADLGRLYNDHAEEILAKYCIEERPAAERARDRLSQALFKEIQQGREIWLDLREVAEESWQKDPFSASTREILGERYGARHRPVRVAPMAHHMMGGVRIDAHGATSVPGLFAAGEVTGGLHGANRMGGNALTETQVFGAKAGNAAASWAKRGDSLPLKEVSKVLTDPVSRSRTLKTEAGLRRLKEKTRKLLWEQGGIIRHRESLVKALEIIKHIREEARHLPTPDDPLEVQKGLELQLGTRAAELILEAALRREESRGAHFRRDFPQQDDARWLGHQKVQLPRGSQKEKWSFDPITPSVQE